MNAFSGLFWQKFTSVSAAKCIIVEIFSFGLILLIFEMSHVICLIFTPEYFDRDIPIILNFFSNSGIKLEPKNPLKPVTKTRTRVHSRYKEFLILDGEIIDFGGRIFKKGNFISYKPNSSHSSFSKKGCLILTFMRGQNNQINKI